MAIQLMEAKSLVKPYKNHSFKKESVKTKKNGIFFPQVSLSERYYNYDIRCC